MLRGPTDNTGLRAQVETRKSTEGAIDVSAIQSPRPQMAPLGVCRVTVTILVHVACSLLVCLLKRCLTWRA